MQFKKFQYKIHVEIILTREEIDLLLDISALHYDSVCKSAGKPGGFIYGWKNQLEFNRKDSRAARIETYFRELDTCCKILEISTDCKTGMPNNGPELYWELHKLLKDINDEHEKLNKL